jgi:hypothetical protein
MLSIGSEALPRGAARAGFCRSARLRGGAWEVAVGRMTHPNAKKPCKRRQRASRFRAKRQGKATKRRMGTIVQFSNQVGFRDCLPTREDREKAIAM